MLNQGVKIRKIMFNDNQALYVGQRISDRTIISITVEMQNGQMSLVPWLKVVYDGGEISLWNAALVEGVQLLEEGVDVEQEKGK